MKYIVQVELDAVTGLEVEGEPNRIQEWIDKWRALNPIGMYFSLSRRAITVIVDVTNEDVMFEALHASWVLTKDYPDVWPAVDVHEFPAILQRLGVGS